MNARPLVVLFGLLVVLAGCTTRSSGDPIPGTRDHPINETSEPKYADLLPPRTRELDLTGVDPCTDLFTDQQLRELAYDLGYAHPPGPDHSNIHDGPTCTYASSGGAGGTDRNMRTLIGISTTEGALAWVIDPAREPDTRPDVVTVEGFSAIVLPHPKLPDNCLIVVDTAEGQYLEVESSPGAGEDTTYDPYCAEAERVAGMAIQTVSKAR